MLYLWKLPEYLANKHYAIYDTVISPNSSLFWDGTKLDPEEVNRCYCYYRSQTLELPDEPLIRCHLRRLGQRAFIFTPTELFYCTDGMGNKVNINLTDLNKLKVALSLADKDLDQEPKILTDEQLKMIGSIKGCPLFSRIPIFTIKVSKAEISKFDCIPTSRLLLLVNQKIIDLLLALAPNDVQFFDTELHCKDGILTGYKIVNVVNTIKGINYEKSIYSTSSYGVMSFKYLTFKPGCMGSYKLAIEGEAKSNLLVTEDIKQAFEKAKIKGTRFVRPEEYYRPLRPEDLIG